MFDKLICVISIICLAVVLVLFLVLKDSLRTYFKSLSLSLGGQVQEVLVLVLVLGGQALVLVLVLGSQVLVLVLGGQVHVNIPLSHFVAHPGTQQKYVTHLGPFILVGLIQKRN